MNDRPNIRPDKSQAILVAQGSTRQGDRPRWTEISVYYFPVPPIGGKRWMTETLGMTEVQGETTRRQMLRAGTLDRALKLIDESGDVGRIVAETAREWAEDNRLLIQAGEHKPFAEMTEEEALRWLYGQPDPGCRGFAQMLAKDMGVGESTIRMQLAGGKAVRVPLRAILPFVDREAFRRHRERQAEGQSNG
jgi:hypothetical protein